MAFRGCNRRCTPKATLRLCGAFECEAFFCWIWREVQGDRKMLVDFYAQEIATVVEGHFLF